MQQVLLLLSQIAVNEWPTVEPMIVKELQTLEAKATGAEKVAIQLALAALTHLAPLPPASGA